MRQRAASATAVVAAAGLLVLGVDCATYATTGSSLILGHFNHADSTTTLVTTNGPALRLDAADQGSPALAISNDVKVRHLNAAKLDGNTAAQLGSHAVTYRAGRRKDVISGLQIWSLPVTPGAYQVSFQATVIPTSGDPQSPVQVVCGVADLNTMGNNTHIYTADSSTYIGDFPAIMSGAEAIRVGPQQQPALICTTAGNSPATDFTLYKPVTASFIHINSHVVRAAQPLPSRGQRNLSLLPH
jgi:hypothetical protein